MAPTVIPGVVAEENVAVKFVPSITNTAAPSLASEINGATAVTLECLLTEVLGYDASASLGDDKRMCSKQAQKIPGVVEYTVSDAVYAYDPQGLATLPINKAYAALVDGASGYLVFRRGKHVDTAWAAADKVEVVPVRVTMQVPMPAEANAILKCKSGFAVVGTVVKNAVIAA